MGGIIGESGHPTQGATPPLPSTETPGDDGPAAREGGLEPVGKRLTVCIVDDSSVQTDIARALLEKAGHDVVAYLSGADVLRAIPSPSPDCILMDIMMPGIDGYELCRRLRAIDALAGTKLVMMSTKAFPFDRRRAQEMGA